MVPVWKACYLLIDPPSHKGSYLFSLQTGRFYVTADENEPRSFTLLVGDLQLNVLEVPVQSYPNLLGGLCAMDLSAPIPESTIWSILQRGHQTIDELDGRAILVRHSSEQSVKIQAQYEYGERETALFALGVLALSMMTISPFTRASQCIEDLVLDLLDYDFTLESSIYTSELVEHIAYLCAHGKRMNQITSPRCISMVSIHPLTETPTKIEGTKQSHLQGQGREQEHLLFAKPEIKASKRLT